jgi:hypothetical protein
VLNAVSVSSSTCGALSTNRPDWPSTGPILNSYWFTVTSAVGVSTPDAPSVPTCCALTVTTGLSGLTSGLPTSRITRMSPVALKSAAASGDMNCFAWSAAES